MLSCASHAVPPVQTTVLVGWEAARAETCSGFCFLPLTVNRRPDQGKEVRGDGSDVGTTHEEKEGKEITLNWCWKSSFRKCEIVTCGIFKVQLWNPKVGLFFLKNRWYLLLCKFFIYASFILVCMNILSEFCLRKDEGWLSDVILTKVFEQRWLFILPWRLYLKLNIHISLIMKFL